VTYADPALLAARSYLMGCGIPGDAIGVVGDQSHQSSGGYHVGNDVLSLIGKLNTDYSKRQTERDRPGSNAAMALDIGGLTADELYQLTKWLIEQVRAGAWDARNVREVIGRRSPAGGVTRFDVLGIQPDSGSSDHESHTHISYFRDSEGEDKTALFRRYFEGAPAPAPAPDQEDTMILYHAIDTQGTAAAGDDEAVFAVVGGGGAFVSDGPIPQTLANKLAQPPGSPDKGTGNSSALNAAEWNALMDMYDVVGHRFWKNADGSLGDWKVEPQGA
jgi:hypothetical protein